MLADSARLSQVFLNLLVNAAQAIDEGNVDNNCITIRVRPMDDDTACVEFTDTGCGIPDELLPRIFEPFVTTKDVGQGTGLGLHICHNIVSVFSGALQVKSELGVGNISITYNGVVLTVEQSKAKILPQQALDILHNLSAITDPGATDDVDAGYSAGS